MAVQLEQLHADRLRLENRNSVLEKVTLSTVCVFFVTLSSVCMLLATQVSVPNTNVRSTEVACICVLPPALRSKSFVQVLEMKEIEETKPSTSSSGKTLLVTVASRYILFCAIHCVYLLSDSRDR